MRTFYKLTPDEIKQVQTEIKAKKAAAKEDELKRLEAGSRKVCFCGFSEHNLTCCC